MLIHVYIYRYMCASISVNTSYYRYNHDTSYKNSHTSHNHKITLLTIPTIPFWINGYEILTRRPHCPCLVVPASTPASHEAVSRRAVDLRQKGFHCEAFNQGMRSPRWYCSLGPGGGTAHAAQGPQPELRVAMLNHGSPSWCACWPHTHACDIFLNIYIYIYIYI